MNCILSSVFFGKCVKFREKRNIQYAFEACLDYKCDSNIVEVADTARRLTL